MTRRLSIAALSLAVLATGAVAVFWWATRGLE